jgi:hypothetical protein
MTDPVNETYIEINNAALEVTTPRPGLPGVLNPAAMVAGALLSLSSLVFAADTLAWDKTFLSSDKVNHRKVFFRNRLGIHLVADLYIPKDIDRSKKYPAIVVGTPFGAVKE